MAHLLCFLLSPQGVFVEVLFYWSVSGKSFTFLCDFWMKILAKSAVAIIIVLLILQSIKPIKHSAFFLALLGTAVSFGLKCIFVVLLDLHILFESSSFLFYLPFEIRLLLKKLFQRTCAALRSCFRFESALGENPLGLLFF